MNKNDLLLSQLKDTAREIRQFQLVCFSMLDAVNGAIKELEAMQQGGWTPCRKKLPVVDIDVIVFYPSWHSNPIQIAHLTYDKLSFELSDGEFHFPASAVTHWKPMPEPPAMGTQVYTEADYEPGLIEEKL